MRDFSVQELALKDKTAPNQCLVCYYLCLFVLFTPTYKLNEIRCFLNLFFKRAKYYQGAQRLKKDEGKA